MCTQPVLYMRSGKAGVRPVFYEDHSEVPSILAQVYTSALPGEGILVPCMGREPRRYKPDEIWDILWQDKRWIDSTIAGARPHGIR